MQRAFHSLSNNGRALVGMGLLAGIVLGLSPTVIGALIHVISGTGH